MNTVLAIFCRLAAIGAPPVADGTDAVPSYVATGVAIEAPAALPALSEAELITAQRHPVHAATPAPSAIRLAQHSDAAEPSVGSETRTPSQAELQEIMRIRTMTSPLRGSLLDDGEFARHLKTEFPASPSGERQLQPHGQPPSSVSAEVWRQRTMRSMDRRLEAIAQDLEELERHEEARQARELAERLK